MIVLGWCAALPAPCTSARHAENNEPYPRGGQGQRHVKKAVHTIAFGVFFFVCSGSWFLHSSPRETCKNPGSRNLDVGSVLTYPIVRVACGVYSGCTVRFDRGGS